MQKRGLHLFAFLSLAGYFLASMHVGFVGGFCDHGMEVAHPIVPVHDEEDGFLPDTDGPADCPHDSDGPCCPGPDSCSLCSLAKLPFVPTESAPAQAFRLIGACSFEETFHYLPPPPSSLIRPPRA